MTKGHTLSTSATATLSAAAKREDRIALPPERLPADAQRAVVQSLLKAGLLEEVAADDDQPGWRVVKDGLRSALRITDAGLNAVGSNEPPIDSALEPSETAQSGPQAPEAEQAPTTPREGPSAPVAAQRTSTRRRQHARKRTLVDRLARAHPGHVGPSARSVDRSPLPAARSGAERRKHSVWVFR